MLRVDQSEQIQSTYESTEELKGNLVVARLGMGASALTMAMSSYLGGAHVLPRIVQDISASEGIDTTNVMTGGLVIALGSMCAKNFSRYLAEHHKLQVEAQRSASADS